MLVTNSLTDSLTDCRLVNLIDVTLVCEDGNSKLFDVVTVVYVVDAEILKLMLGRDSEDEI